MERTLSSSGYLRSSKLFLSQVIDFLPDPIFVIDLKGKVIVWNRAMEELTGVKAGDMVGRSDYEYSLPFYGARRPILIDLVLNPDPDLDEKYTAIRRDRDSLIAESVGLPMKRDLWGKASPIYGKKGEIIGAIESIRDITDKKKTEENLFHTMNTYRAIFENTSSAMVILDEDTIISLINSEFENLSGYSRDEVEGKMSWRQFVAAEEIQRMQPLHVLRRKSRASAPRRYEFRFKDRSGSIKDILLTIDIIEGTTKSVASLLDITELKHAERALRSSQEKYHDIFLNVSDLLFIHDLKGNFIETNLASKKSTGYTETDLINMNIKDILPERFKSLFKDSINRLLETGYDEGLMTITTKTGEERILEYRTSLILSLEGNPARVRGSARDITSRIRAARQLKKERDLITSIIQTSPAFYDAVDTQGKVIFMNQAMLNALGYSLSEVVGKDYFELFIPEEDRAGYKDAMARMVSSKGPIVHENRVLTKTDITLLVQWQGKAVFRENGELEFIFGIGIDISQQRHTQELALSSEKKFEIVFQSSHVPSAITDIETGMIINANPALESLTGLTLEEARGKTSLDIDIWNNPADRDRIIGKIVAGNTVDNEEVEFRVKNGEIRNILYSGRLIDINGKPHVLTNARDITEHKRMEGDLRESEEKFRLLFEKSGDANLIIDEGRYIDCNEAAFKMSGYTDKSQLLSLRPADAAPQFQPDGSLSSEKANSMMELAIENGSHQFEWVRQRFDGTELYMDVMLTAIPMKGRRLIYTTWRDISMRKRAEEALRQSEERFRMMAEASPEIFWMATPNWGKVTYVSPALGRIAGITTDEVYRDPRVWLNLVHPEDKGYVSSTIGFGQEHAEDAEYDFRIIRKDGAVRWIHTRRYAVRDAQGGLICFTGISEDITERKLSEEERRIYEARLMRSQKLEAIGTLAGGIAHDFNNILSAIIGYSELAIDELPPGSNISTNIKEVLKAGDRAKDLVRQILTFSRQMETEKKPVKIHLIIKEALKLLRSSIPSTITITERIDTSAGTVFADSTQIHQVIMNLCTNAYHALLPVGGDLMVSLEQLYLDSGFISKHPPLSAGAHLLITVRDTGCGMDTETLKRIFDPFFTTKEKAKGTGLGLATVHGIITGLGGVILVESWVGKGSTFKIFLPVSQWEQDDMDDLNEGHCPGNGESILLVDDEEAIINFTKTMLNQLGYKVEGICSAIDALNYFRSVPDEIDLVITDQTMPGITGSQLAAEILKIRPDIPIILMTGYSEAITPEEAVEQGIKEYLDKPFTKNIIAGAIWRSLKG